ncbi:hypothetical protein J6590_045844 [Homalodisca vitripennis]|nr:hypothetical protein J6590_045844 [Homalodisca vitripennis]
MASTDNSSLECVRDVGRMSGEEREARSVALEKAYVHQVYQQISAAQYPQTHKQSRSWPRVKQFLEDLEPGSLVCDVGCGNGKYLSVNPFIYQLGADRCAQLTEAARQKENEVLVCDNLALPFRDDSFDAVLSIAVVHHFATTERRVGALRELARVLRIGGRLVISVWAMEQRHRKFESQDVLVPWHKPQHLSTPSLELTSTTTTTSEEDGPPPYHAYTQTSDSDSCRAGASGQRKRGRNRHKGRSIDPAKPLTSSPSSSSLSSPNETCYSFVRRALQKLAGSKRGGSRHRPWFLDSWTSCAKEPPSHRYDPEGCEDVHNLPIELRRLEEEQEAPQRRQTFACSHQLSDIPLNHKSKSLTDIIAVEQRSIVRSRSSVPSLEVSPPEEAEPVTTETTVTGTKPKLVKQKQSVCDEDFDGEDGDEPTDMRDLVKALPEFKISGYGGIKRGNVFKQSSMNEELMSTERLREKERVRQNIQKQASLNEDLMFRRNRTLDSLRESLFSVSTAKRFQLLKNGFTNKIKSSTTGIEKVAGASFKNGFVRILQGWTGQDVGSPIPQPAPPPHTPATDSQKLLVEEKKEIERRHSREDGSDSSKDSSLQSDTSVDSEDSFASVIFVPKHEPPQEQNSSNTSPTLQSTPASPGPTSPKVKLPPPISPKMKQPPQISFGMSSHPSSPKLKHPSALLGSPTPSSPKIKFYSQPTSPRPYQTSFLTSPTSKSTFKLQASPNGSNMSSPTCKSFPFTHPSASKASSSSGSFTIPSIGHITPTSPTADQPRVNESSPILTPTQAPTATIPSPKDGKTASLTSPKEETKSSAFLELWPSLSPGVSPTSPSKDSTKRLLLDEDLDRPLIEKQTEKMKKIQDILKQKEKSGGSRSQFPLVRRAVTVSTSRGGSDTPPTRPLPRLMSLELFNPETDDMDSDSSGVSSPDSVGSVISVLNDDDHSTQGNNNNFVLEILEISKSGDAVSNDPEQMSSNSELKLSCLPVASTQEKIRLEIEEAQIETIHSPRVSPSQSLLEAAADVASSLEETVDAVIQSSPRAKRKQLKLFENTDPLIVLQDDLITRRSQKITGREKTDESPSLPENTFKRKVQDRWSLQPEGSASFLPLESSKASSLGAISKTKTTQPSEDFSKEKDSWDEECRQHLADFAEKLSEKLLAEIDRYREQSSIPCLSIESENLPSGIQNMNDPYLNRLSEELHDLKTLSLELHESHTSFVRKLRETDLIGVQVSVDKPNEEVDVKDYFSETIDQEEAPMAPSSLIPILSIDQKTSSNVNLEQSTRIEILQPEIQTNSEAQEGSSEDSENSNKVKLKSNEDVDRSVDNQETVTIITENLFEQRTEVTIELSDAESSTSSDNSWADSRRNTILHTDKHLHIARGEKSNVLSCGEDVTRIEILPGSEIPRRPSISIETTDRVEKAAVREIFDSGQLRPNISVESSDAGDISERTASSSDGSRSGSRRDTIQICDSGSVLSLRPGTSLESSDAGDVSERTGSGSEGSRTGDSRRNTISIGDHTSGSQTSLLRPEVSLESSDCGDVSERTGSSDCSRADSRRDTSSAGKTASTASLASDKASDCSKDATYADRRIARCDGRSSSEETAPQRRGCMNKLVRQRASTQEPPETLTKTESCETSLSGSTSQESLMSDSGGGAITFHRYYHVFREGELDQLIERYVENLHIISSYYDHANWCVIAEKVHVWTI